MSRNSKAGALRQHLETLFPGKWLHGGDGNRVLRTGIKEIDAGITRGFLRRRISEWSGNLSSGKTTLLRRAVHYWVSTGLNVAYVDTFSRLVAADWTFFEKQEEKIATVMQSGGHFIVVRVSEHLQETLSIRDIKRESFWVAEQLIRSSVFDVVCFDLGAMRFISDRVFVRLQRALDKSRAALILMRDVPERQDEGKLASDTLSNAAWGCHTRASFQWSGPFRCEEGIAGAIMIEPVIRGSLSRDGLTQDTEIDFTANVTNRLFTHIQAPDRRTSKTRARS